LWTQGAGPAQRRRTPRFGRFSARSFLPGATEVLLVSGLAGRVPGLWVVGRRPQKLLPRRPPLVPPPLCIDYSDEVPPSPGDIAAPEPSTGRPRQAVHRTPSCLRIIDRQSTTAFSTPERRGHRGQRTEGKSRPRITLNPPSAIMSSRTLIRNRNHVIPDSDPGPQSCHPGL